MENIEENKLKMIGGRVPTEFAENFANYCKEHGINQRILFHNLTKWWFERSEIIQWHIHRGRVSEAHAQIAEEVSAQAADEIVSDSEGDSSKQKQKKGRGRSAKSA